MEFSNEGSSRTYIYMWKSLVMYQVSSDGIAFVGGWDAQWSIGGLGYEDGEIACSKKFLVDGGESVEGSFSSDLFVGGGGRGGEFAQMNFRVLFFFVYIYII